MDSESSSHGDDSLSEGEQDAIAQHLTSVLGQATQQSLQHEDDEEDEDEEAPQIQVDQATAGLLTRYLRFLQTHLRNARLAGRSDDGDGDGDGGDDDNGDDFAVHYGMDVDEDGQSTSWVRECPVPVWEQETRAFARHPLGRQIIADTRVHRYSVYGFEGDRWTQDNYRLATGAGAEPTQAAMACSAGDVRPGEAESLTAPLPSPSRGSLLTLLADRQSAGLGPAGRAAAHQRSFEGSVAHRFLPAHAVPIDVYDSQAFCGQFSATGRLFMSAAQDRCLRIYDTATWRLETEIVVRDVGWSVISTDYSPDERWAVASAWSESAYLYRTRASDESPGRADEEWREDNEEAEDGGGGGDGDQGNSMNDNSAPEHGYSLRSRGNNRSALRDRLRRQRGHASEQVQLLDFQPHTNRFCLFSIEFSPDSTEILGGSSDCGVYLYNLERRERTLRVSAHLDDVNAIKWADAAVFYSGSDDRLVKVWDRRTLSSERAEPVGVFAGHNEGITHIDARGDSRYLISNSKDQTVKLWDMRRMAPEGHIEPLVRRPPSTYDYRYGSGGDMGRRRDGASLPSPAEARRTALGSERAARRRHRWDTSLMTYLGGHEVYQTLLRAYFSPAHTTGGAFIVAGSYDGSVAIYDVLSGQVAKKLLGHERTVRDVSWHPFEPMIATTAWDGQCLLFTAAGEPPEPLARRAATGDYTAHRNSVRTNTFH